MNTHTNQLAVLDVDGDELLDSARAEVLVGTGVDVAMNPVVLDDVDASTPVLTAVADDDTLLLNTCVDGVRVAVPVILEVVNDVNTSVVAGDIHRDGGVVTDIDSVEVDGAGNSQSDSCGGGCGAINTDDDLNGQGGLGSDDSKRGGLEGIGLKTYRLKVQIWLLTCHMRQLQQVNYGIVVGLKTLKCELIKSGFRTLRRLMVSSAPDGQKVLAERADGGMDCS